MIPPPVNSAWLASPGVTESANEGADVTVEFPYSGEDFIAAKYELRWWKIFRRYMLFMGPVFISGLGLTLFVLAITLGEMNVMEALADTLPTVALGVFHGFVPWMIRTFDRFNHRRNIPDGTPQQRRFGPHGFAHSAGVPSTPWGLITEVNETSRAFLISNASSTVSIYMPKRVLTPEQLNYFRETLEKEFGSRPDKLKLLPTRNQLAME